MVKPKDVQAKFLEAKEACNWPDSYHLENAGKWRIRLDGPSTTPNFATYAITDWLTASEMVSFLDGVILGARHVKAARDSKGRFK